MTFRFRAYAPLVNTPPGTGTRVSFLTDNDISTLVTLAGSTAIDQLYIDAAAGGSTMNVRTPIVTNGVITGATLLGSTWTPSTWTTIETAPAWSTYTSPYWGSNVLIQSAGASPWDGTKVVFLVGLYVACGYLPGQQSYVVTGRGNTTYWTPAGTQSAPQIGGVFEAM